MLMLMEASKIHNKPTAIHRVGEKGIKNKANELRIAPIKK